MSVLTVMTLNVARTAATPPAAQRGKRGCGAASASALALAIGITGCQDAPTPPSVSFAQSQQVGRWTEPADASDPAGAPQQLSEPARQAAPNSAAPPQVAVAPSAAAPAAAPRPANMTAAMSGTAGQVSAAAAGSTPVANGGGGAQAPAPTAPTSMLTSEAAKPPVSSVSYSLKTETYGGRYKPRNVGAIWVENADGELVKSLEVWSWLRTRYLESYAKARDGARVDVTSSATLSRHTAHMASWDLRDMSGTAAAPGRYTLWLEMSEDDGPGKTISVEFDTSQGPGTITQPDSPGFANLTIDMR